MSELNGLPVTQKQRLVKILLEADDWLTLFEIQDLCRERFGVLDSETALSARWRELPPEGRVCRKREGTHSTFEYRLLRLNAALGAGI